MKVRSLGIPDVKLLEPRSFTDERGSFFEAWNEREYLAAGIVARFVQDNAVVSKRGVLRGLHCQRSHPQGKLIRVIAGRVFDVAVDLRPGSDTCGKWVGEMLDAENNAALWIPPGFAHGYLTLSDLAHVYYKCTDFYAPSDEHVLRWDDPALGIDWPLADIGVPLVAERDRNGATLATTIAAMRPTTGEAPR